MTLLADDMMPAHENTGVATYFMNPGWSCPCFVTILKTESYAAKKNESIYHSKKSSPFMFYNLC